MAEYIVELPNTQAAFDWLDQFAEAWHIDWQSLDSIDVVFTNLVDADLAVQAFTPQAN